MSPVLAMLVALAAYQPQQPAPTPAAQAHVGKGYELEKDQRFSDAATEFQAALALDPTLARARYQLAVCSFALGRLDDARREFVRLRAETHNDPRVIYFLARIDLVERRLDAATREFKSVVAEPPFPDTAYYLGSAYLDQGDLSSAERWLRKAQPLNPRDFRVPDHLARIYQREGHSAKAEAEYAESAKLRENYNEGAEDGVKCSRALESGDGNAAREACAKLDQPNDPDRLTVLGMIYGRHGRYADAVEPLRRADELDPGSSESEHNLGLTYFRLKRYQQARGPLERAVALRPDFFDSNALLGATLFALQQDAIAYDILKHAHQLNPADSDTQELLFKTANALGSKSHAAKNYPEALKYLQTAAELRPQDPSTHAHLAIVYRETGDSRRAEIEKQAAERLAR